jgi:hypothetical protein
MEFSSKKIELFTKHFLYKPCTRTRQSEDANTYFHSSSTLTFVFYKFSAAEEAQKIKHNHFENQINMEKFFIVTTV